MRNKKIQDKEQKLDCTPNCKHTDCLKKMFLECQPKIYPDERRTEEPDCGCESDEKGIRHKGSEHNLISRAFNKNLQKKGLTFEPSSGKAIETEPDKKLVRDGEPKVACAVYHKDGVCPGYPEVSEPKDTCKCSCHHVPEKLKARNYNPGCPHCSPLPVEGWEVYSKEGKYNFTPAQRRFISQTLKVERERMITKIDKLLDDKRIRMIVKNNIMYGGSGECRLCGQDPMRFKAGLIDELKEAGDE